MNWTSCLSNPKGITAIYGDDVPSLDHILLHEVILDYEHGLLHLRFDLTQFPDNPPKKWLISGLNSVQLEIQAAGIREIKFQGSIPGEPSPCQMTLQANNGIEVSLESDRISLKCIAQATLLANISAYHDSGTDLNTRSSRRHA